jgi:hypothetical protein
MGHGGAGDERGRGVPDLPRRYRKRYEARVAEEIARVTRELEEYQAMLKAEHRLGRRSRKGSRRRSGATEPGN